MSLSAEVVFGQGLQLVVEEGLRYESALVPACSYAPGFMMTVCAVMFDCCVTKAELSSNGPEATPTPTAGLLARHHVTRPGLVSTSMCHGPNSQRLAAQHLRQG